MPKHFHKSTIGVDFSTNQNKFLVKLHERAIILDFGFAYAGIGVKHMLFQDLQKMENYNAIWACSSILHLPYAELVDERIR